MGYGYWVLLILVEDSRNLRIKEMAMVTSISQASFRYSVCGQLLSKR